MDAATRPATPVPGIADKEPTRSHPLTTDEVWHEIEKASFAVVGHVTPAGEPRSSGVVFKAVGRRLYVAVAPESWKAAHIEAGGRVSVVVPVRRGGILALLMPIPPATISFHATAVVHASGSMTDAGCPARELADLVPPDRRTHARIIELTPEGTFLTFGIGVSLMEMRQPAIAMARVPVA
jgi:hypothetical protein